MEQFLRFERKKFGFSGGEEFEVINLSSRDGGVACSFKIMMLVGMSQRCNH